jgi:hypothetical protein
MNYSDHPCDVRGNGAFNLRLALWGNHFIRHCRVTIDAVLKQTFDILLHLSVTNLIESKSVSFFDVGVNAMKIECEIFRILIDVVIDARPIAVRKIVLPSTDDRPLKTICMVFLYLAGTYAFAYVFRSSFTGPCVSLNLTSLQYVEQRGCYGLLFFKETTGTSELIPFG